MAMRLKERELVGVAASVAAGCRNCTSYYVGAARDAGIAEDEIVDAIGIAARMREETAARMRAYALDTVRGSDTAGPPDGQGGAERGAQMAALAAAYAVNCTTAVEHHLAAVRALGVSDEDLRDLIDSVVFVKGRAASHVEHLVEDLPPAAESQ